MTPIQLLIIQASIQILFEQYKQRIEHVMQGECNGHNNIQEEHSLSLLSLLGVLACKYPSCAAFLCIFDVKSNLTELIALTKKFDSPLLNKVANQLEKSDRVSFLEVTLKLFYLIDLKHSPQFLVSMLAANHSVPFLKQENKTYDLSQLIQNVILTSIFNILETHLDSEPKTLGDYASYNIWAFYSQLYLSILENCWKDKWGKDNPFREEQMQTQRAFMNLTLRFIERLDCNVLQFYHGDSRKLFKSCSEMIDYYRQWSFQRKSGEMNSDKFRDMLWILHERSNAEQAETNIAQNTHKPHVQEKLDYASKIAAIAQTSFQECFNNLSSLQNRVSEEDWGSQNRGIDQRNILNFLLDFLSFFTLSQTIFL